MSAEEKLAQAKDRLTIFGKEKGHLTYEDLNDVLPEDIVSSIDIDNISIILDSTDNNVIEYDEKQESVNATLETDKKCESSGISETEISSEDLSHTDDLARIYLREMGMVPLLTREEEIRIAKRIESGRLKMLKAITQIPIDSRELIYLKEMAIMDRPEHIAGIREKIKHFLDHMDHSLSQLKTYKCQRTIHNNTQRIKKIEKEIGLSILQLRKIYSEIEVGRKETDLAKKELVEANLRLVVSIAKKYLNRGLPFLDLIQEGNIGLMKAVDKFEHQRGYKFSTYATWWIRQSITRAIADKARAIRIPVHMIESINKLTRIIHILVQELGREPTPQEISERTNMNVNKVKSVLNTTKGTISLDTPIGGEEDTHLRDFIEDKRAESPLDSFLNINLAEKMDNILQTLNYREEKVIRKRFGISELSSHTLEEVGQDFNVTRERIRQIEANALRKLRHPNRSKHLKDFYDP